MSYWEIFWAGSVGRIMRWILFLPVGLTVVFLLTLIPPLFYFWAMSYKIDMSLGSIMLAIFAVSMAFSLLSLWVGAVYYSAVFSCLIVAPNPKVASVIYGTMYVLFLVINPLYTQLSSGYHFMQVIYTIAVAIIHTVGIVSAYHDDM